MRSPGRGVCGRKPRNGSGVGFLRRGGRFDIGRFPSEPAVDPGGAGFFRPTTLGGGGRVGGDGGNFPRTSVFRRPGPPKRPNPRSYAASARGIWGTWTTVFMSFSFRNNSGTGGRKQDAGGSNWKELSLAKKKICAKSSNGKGQNLQGCGGASFLCGGRA